MIPSCTDIHRPVSSNEAERLASGARVLHALFAGTVAESQGVVMSSKRVWFITGASRGMGVDFANAALASGHAVVATARDSSRVSQALRQPTDLLALKRAFPGPVQ